MILPFLLPGTYQGEGIITQAELKSSLPFTVTWTIHEPKENTQVATQTIEIIGSETLLKNTYTFQLGGVVVQLNSELGETKGKWFTGSDHLSWELNHPPLFEGFELIRLGKEGELIFHAEYISSASRNEIRGKACRVESKESL